MTKIVYTRFLTVTSYMLNVCVYYGWWEVAKHLIEFRKHHIAKTLRREIVMLKTNGKI